ncbi:MAG: hypothetical protein ITG02_11680 [Patulibacter sp.]|nr:hypothetical protein [Patulibacter sp.]
MSNPTDPTDSIQNLGNVLASAEHYVQEIVAAAENRAAARLRESQLLLDARTAELDARTSALDAQTDQLGARTAEMNARAAEMNARAAELNAIAEELRAAASMSHRQVDRLRMLSPLDALAPVDRAPVAPAPHAGTEWPAPRPDATPPAPQHLAAAPEPAPPVPAPAPAPEQPAPAATHAPPQDCDLPVVGGSGFPETSAPSADPSAVLADPSEQLDSARLVALSMAAGGRSRSEVEAHLRDEMGISDYAPLIDYVFGISTPASVVPSWPPRRKRRTA